MKLKQEYLKTDIPVLYFLYTSIYIGNIICVFKSITTIKCNKFDNINGRTIWQRNYYEHVIRNEKELLKIMEYIEFNPLRWSEDEYYN